MEVPRLAPAPAGAPPPPLGPEDLPDDLLHRCLKLTLDPSIERMYEVRGGLKRMFNSPRQKV
jgi:hypothetical protein